MAAFKLLDVPGRGYFGKSFAISGPGDLHLDIDYDDVDHNVVEILYKRMLDILNQHWVPVDGFRCPDWDSDEAGEDCWGSLTESPGKCSCGRRKERVRLG
jgi:hypothetical protein